MQRRYLLETLLPFVAQIIPDRTADQRELRRQMEVLNDFASRYNALIEKLEQGIMDVRQVESLRRAWRKVDGVLGGKG